MLEKIKQNKDKLIRAASITLIGGSVIFVTYAFTRSHYEGRLEAQRQWMIRLVEEAGVYDKVLAKQRELHPEM